MLKTLPYFVLLLLASAEAQVFRSQWEIEPDRTWIGADFWANRLQDWQIKNGRLECIAKKNLPMRTVHLLTHRLTGEAGFRISTRLGAIRDEGAKPGLDSQRGLLLGAGGSEMDYRAAAIIHHWKGPGFGSFIGVDGAGQVFLDQPDLASPTGDRDPIDDVILEINAEPGTDGFVLRVRTATPEGTQISRAKFKLAGLKGNVALVSNPKPGTGLQAWFGSLELSGPGIVSDTKASFGPIASTQYTLSRSVLKMTAQLLPLGEDEPKRCFLETKKGDDWLPTAEADILVPGWTATFRVSDWDASQDTLYRVVYGDSVWSGIVRKDPVDKPEIVVAGFTGNHNNSHQIGSKTAPTNWESGMWFPHDDIVKSVSHHNPDVLFFSGDQVYEGKSPTFPDRDQIDLDYLYKWYLFCWAYRDLTRDIPTVTIPDDHDVYQGNIWGENGRPIHVDNAGGYVHPASFVQMVHRTQTSHLPDAFDPEPVEQDIPVYFTELNYGRISFAILEDRKFKSGCADHGLPPSGTGRPDHFNNPQFDTRQLDLPGLSLLGNRQHDFLEIWAEDWRTSDFKVALSQTIFANMATHHGPNLDYLIADLDSNGWPQTGRNQALNHLRKAFAFHLAGDQHLATIVHHGVEKHRDSIWSFCVPSIANFYPRAWNPRRSGLNRPDNAPHWQGDHVDGFYNPVTVYAATNPGEDFGVEPKDLHNKMPGYGIVRFRKPERTITMECWPRRVDPAQTDAQQYPGWPKTINQRDNYLREAAGYLPPLEVGGMENPVIQVREAITKKLVYALRIKGNKITPWVFAPGRYDLRIGEPDLGIWNELKGIEASVDPYSEARLIEF
ncbi:MAG: alkaline phosphatase D family protein [Verrucomicrobiota bacterium]